MALLERRLNFLKKCYEIHGNNYEYLIESYTHNRIKMDIICPTHGIFSQLPCSHLEGRGCKKCSDEYRRIDNFTDRSEKLHNGKYDYSLVDYINSSTKVKIICPTHGEFSQQPNKHLRGHGCLKCSRNKVSIIEFIEKSNDIHDYKYDYSLTEYKNAKSKVKILCEEHGVFDQTPNSHLNGRGCSKCSNNKKMNSGSFIKRSIKTHGDIYDYSLVEYKNARSKVKIICKEHGMFEQKAHNHIKGYGCQLCSNISNGELKISEVLIKLGISHNKQQGFEDCRYINKLSFDFYLPELNSCIEYDGKQHFEPIEFFGGIESFNKQQEKDNIKNKYCGENNIKLLRIPYTEFDNIEKIIEENYAY